MTERKDNCLLWAWRKFKKDGGYIAIRWSWHKHWFPVKFHFLHKEEQCPITGESCRGLTSWVPFVKTLGNVPPFRFEGYEKRGDDRPKDD